MRSHRLILWLGLLALYAATAWIGGLVALVVVVIASAFFVLRLRRALAPTIRCPAGHTVPTYGRFECSVCRAQTMGSAWRCDWCGARFGHISCPTCGLSCGSPLGG